MCTFACNFHYDIGMDKHIPYYIYSALLIVGCWLLAGCGSEDRQAAESEVDTIPLMVMQIKKCSRLYTAEYRVHKIVTHDDEMRLRGTFFSQEFNIPLPMGDRKIAIPMDAKLKAYIDFSDFSEKNIRRQGKQIELVLPDPQVELTSSRIDHEEVKKQVSLLRKNYSDEELTRLERQGRAAIVADVPRMGIIGMARDGAAHTLIPMIVAMGFDEKDITISFRKEFTLDDMPRLLSKPVD